MTEHDPDFSFSASFSRAPDTKPPLRCRLGWHKWERVRLVKGEPVARGWIRTEGKPVGYRECARCGRTERDA